MENSFDLNAQFENIISSLNPQQKQGVEHLDGPLLILAGAGSGKTRVLTVRTAALICKKGVHPSEILAVTFTNKAAKEMQERVHNLLRDLGVRVDTPMWFGTFHSICVRILREQQHLLDTDGSGTPFTIFDSSDQLSQLKKILQTLNIDEKLSPAKSHQARINSLKSDGVTAEEFAKRSQNHSFERKQAQVYSAYESEMKKQNAFDFGDLILKTYELFRTYPEVLEHYSQRFRYILVDEYQDTNRIQYLLISLLSQKHKNLCVVGDEDQSIYSWRGATIQNILNFEKDFENAVAIKLEQNYRSTRTIVEAATQMISNNRERKDKTLYTENREGEKIRIIEELSDFEEARFVVRDLIKQIDKARDFGHGDDKGLQFKDIAILYRTNAQSRLFEEQLRLNQIPYKLIGGMKFFERAEIKDLLMYMRLILNPKDEIAFKRVINTPARGIGKTSIEKLEAFSQVVAKPMLLAIPEAIEKKIFHHGLCLKLRNFLEWTQSLSAQASTLTVTEILREILHKTQYVESLRAENTAESMGRIENIEELNNALAQFEEERGEEATLQTFLEEMALISDLDQSGQPVDNAVTLMTLHVAKGLEFPCVYLVGLEEGLFPSARTLDGGDPSDLEEERRLFYVGMTRAETLLTLTYARMRRIWGTEQHYAPSRFLAEIPEKYVRTQSQISRPKFLDRANSFGATSGASQSSRAISGFDPDSQMPEHRAKSPYTPGQWVRHPTFGNGQILNFEGSGDLLKVEVLFQDQSTRKFVAKYARLESLVDPDLM